MLKKRFKFGFCVCLVIFLGIYSLGINTLRWLNDVEMIHLHLMSYSEDPVHDTHDEPTHSSQNVDNTHSHSHRHSADAPIHEHSHPETPCLHWGNFALPDPLAGSFSSFLNSSDFIPTTSNPMHSTSLLEGIFRPPIS